MRIELLSVVFDGFQSPDRRAEIAFSGQQTSIIFGSNGCGKTTFLKLLHALLGKDDSALEKGNVWKSTIIYRQQDDDELKTVVVRRVFRSFEADVQSVGFDWEEFENSSLNTTRSLSLGVERGVTTQALSVEPIDIGRFLTNHTDGLNLKRSDVNDLSARLAVFLNRQGSMRSKQYMWRVRGKNNDLQLEQEHSLLQNINISNIESLLVERYRIARSYASEKIQNALFDTLALAIDATPLSDNAQTMPDDLADQILASKERILEALNDGPENNFKQRVISILSSTDTLEDVKQITNNSMLCLLIWNMIKELKLEKQMLNSINTFTDTFNSFLSEGKELVVTHERVYIKVRGDRCEVDTLSSGERHLFTFLALVVIAANQRNFLIIDEPEISLNPHWQRNLISLLESLAPETQIILASHSPMLARNRPTMLVELKPQLIEVA